MDLTADTTAYKKLAAALKGADQQIQTATAAAQKSISKDYGKYVLLQGAAGLPKRGGLSYRVAGSTITSTSSGMKATIALRARHADIPALDQGVIRHPTFGHKPWTSQKIRANLFSTPFAEGAPQIRAAWIKEMTKALTQIAAAGSTK